MKYYELLNTCITLAKQVDYIIHDNFIHILFDNQHNCVYYYSGDSKVPIVSSDYIQDTLKIEYHIKDYVCSRFDVTTTIENQDYQVLYNVFTDISTKRILLIDIYMYRNPNLLNRLRLHHNTLKLGNRLINKVRVSLINSLGRYQLIICYLLIKRYTNSEIATMLNELRAQQVPISITAVNKQIEKLKKHFNIYSKNSLIKILASPLIKYQIERRLIEIE